MFSLIALYFEYRKLKTQSATLAVTAARPANDAGDAKVLQRAA